MVYVQSVGGGGNCVYLRMQLCAYSLAWDRLGISYLENVCVFCALSDEERLGL